MELHKILDKKAVIFPAQRSGKKNHCRKSCRKVSFWSLIVL